jgi:hypothetical protein
LVARFSDSNGKDRRRYNNGNGVQQSRGLHRPLTPTLGWGAHRQAAPVAQPKAAKRRVPDAIYTLRGYKAWAAKVRQSWEPES